MSDDTMPEAAAASSPSDAPGVSATPFEAPGEGALTTGTPGEDALGGEDQPPRPRRRRGSRGGRNRRKKPVSAATNGAASDVDGVEASDEFGDADDFVPHDYTDAAADRGLTTDDVADVAREEAGLPPASSPEPPIADGPAREAAPGGVDPASATPVPRRPPGRRR